MMTIHKLSAGDGYLYYTREIASGDERRSGNRELSDYYTAEGNPPGLWIGSGTAELGVSGTVTEPQMKALFGEGLHPDADRIIEEGIAQGLTPPEAIRRARLGRRYYRYEQTEGPLAARIQDAVERFEARKERSATDEERRRLRGTVGAAAFREGFGRSPKSAEELSRYITANTRCARRPVAGYDLVFRNKYGSLLWALADEATRLEVEAAHEQAIAETLTWIERNALATRTGINGIAQEDVRGGLVAARYRHYDSRRGDPLLHDHVVVANKVRGLDGKWRSIDGKLLYAMGVAASELYNQRVVEELCRRLGLRAEEREVTLGKRPVMAISGLEDDLVDAFSKRAQDIRADLGHLLAEYRARHGKEPDVRVRMALIEQAAQQTRPPKKKARALADLRSSWRAEAIRLFGVTRIDSLLESTRRAAVPAVEVDLAETANTVLEIVSGERSVWGRRHVLAEARRQVVRLTGGRGDTTGLAERITQHALDSGSLNVTPPDLHRPFAPLQRADGTSIYRRRESELYTSPQVLADEELILNAARRPVPPACSPDRFRAAADRFDGPPLDGGQLRLAEVFACSAQLVVAGIGPAGSGKTTALQLVRDAVAAGGSRLICLAPSSRAAKVMEDDLDTAAHTLHAWLAQRIRVAEGRRVKDTYALRHGDVIVVDEAGMAGTRNLARIVAEAEQAGALVRLIGDPAQLGAVESGGALRLLSSEVGAVELETLHRFRTDGEAEATRKLRDGSSSEAFRWHIARDRVVGGQAEVMLDSVFTAWQTDTEAGHQSLMMADDTDSVRALNARAQAFQIAAGNLDLSRTIRLRDELDAAVGDVIVTRKNERRLLVNGGRDFVKNGDQWRVEYLDSAGNAQVRHTVHHGRTMIPVRYLHRHAELGYASTTHRAQGLTVDTAHGLLTARTSREAAYVMATRGRHTNHLHVVAEEGQTMHDVLDTVARSSRPSISAHETIRAEQDRVYGIAQLAAEYTDIHHRADTQRLQHLARRTLGQAAEPFIAADAWPAVERALRAAEADGWNAARVLTRAHDMHGFGDADDLSAVLAWRIHAHITEARATAERASSRPRPLRHLSDQALARLRRTSEGDAVAEARHRLRLAQRAHDLDAARAAAEDLAHLRWTLSEGRERLDPARIIAEQVRAEQRLRSRLPEGPPREPDHTGPLPAWLAPDIALHDPDTPAEWRTHLTERRAALAERLTCNGALLATNPPPWATALGPVPSTESRLRISWEQTAALVDAWRSRKGITDPAASTIGDQPTDTEDARAWTALLQRVQETARRSRGHAAAKARVNDPTTATGIAVRTAESISNALLKAKLSIPADRQAITAAASAFASAALRSVLEGTEPPEPWTLQIGPPGKDEEQQAQWQRLVTAVAICRTAHPTVPQSPLAESSSDPSRTALNKAIALYRRSRAQQHLISTLSAKRTTERHEGQHQASTLGGSPRVGHRGRGQ
ncbi:MobF family relaxase [Streptomyces sp. NPDC049881]|uniref:MobF family relaxase n=1 Tax=Streptomyces sp. NPDC049881 TaxID=3155778 RepID=UPI003415022D